VRGAAGIAITDDAVPRSDLELLAAVAGLLRDVPTRPAVVPVRGGREQTDDLDDVQAGSAQDTGPTPSMSP
jgi:hypothetical protein